MEFCYFRNICSGNAKIFFFFIGMKGKNGGGVSYLCDQRENLLNYSGLELFTARGSKKRFCCVVGT